MNKYIFYLYLTITTIVASLSIGCEDKNENIIPQETAANEWIWEVMSKKYLWNDELPTKSSLRFNNSPKDFFLSLLSNKDGKNKGNGHYYFSRIEKFKERSKAIKEEDSYGFEYILYPVSQQSYFYARILYVLPNSPAAACGLKRGDWIIDVNHQPLTNTSIPLKQGNSAQLTIGKLSYESPSKTYKINKVKEITIGSSHAVADIAIYKDTIYHLSGKKIAYLCYNHFNSGPGGFEDHTYDNQLKAIFAKLASQKINEFVLDLRYNGGGYTSSMQILGSMLTPTSHLSDVFQIEEDNQRNRREMRFLKGLPNLNLSRLYVIVGANTASASEALINGLLPYMDVKLIGSTTYGKNVGATLHRNATQGWDIWPITFRAYNSLLESNYENGFGLEKFRVYSDELALSAMPFIDLGNPQEHLLSEALKAMGVYAIEKNSIDVRNHYNEITPIYSSLQSKPTFGTQLKNE